MVVLGQCITSISFSVSEVEWHGGDSCFSLGLDVRVQFDLFRVTSAFCVVAFRNVFRVYRTRVSRQDREFNCNKHGFHQTFCFEQILGLVGGVGWGSKQFPLFSDEHLRVCRPLVWFASLSKHATQRSIRQNSGTNQETPANRVLTTVDRCCQSRETTDYGTAALDNSVAVVYVLGCMCEQRLTVNNHVVI